MAGAGNPPPMMTEKFLTIFFLARSRECLVLRIYCSSRGLAEREDGQRERRLIAYWRAAGAVWEWSGWRREGGAEEIFII